MILDELAREHSHPYKDFSEDCLANNLLDVQIRN